MGSFTSFRGTKARASLHPPNYGAIYGTINLSTMHGAAFGVSCIAFILRSIWSEFWANRPQTLLRMCDLLAVTECSTSAIFSRHRNRSPTENCRRPLKIALKYHFFCAL